MKTILEAPKSSTLLTKYLYNNYSIWEFVELRFKGKGSYVEENKVNTYYLLESVKEGIDVHIYVDSAYKLALEPFEVCSDDDTILASLVPSNRSIDSYDLTLSFNEELALESKPNFYYEPARN